MLVLKNTELFDQTLGDFGVTYVRGERKLYSSRGEDGETGRQLEEEIEKREKGRRVEMSSASSRRDSATGPPVR